MENHKYYSEVASLANKFPTKAGNLFAVFSDILLVQEWSDVEIINLPTCSQGALRGRRQGSDSVDAVVPCAMSEVLSLGWIKDAFRDLGNPPSLYLAVCTEDSSLVYYKISRGFVKPPL